MFKIATVGSGNKRSKEVTTDRTHTFLLSVFLVFRRGLSLENRGIIGKKVEEVS